MNKRPLMLRTAIVLVVIAVFASAMYPLFFKHHNEFYNRIRYESIKRLGGSLWYIIDAAHFYFTT